MPGAPLMLRAFFYLSLNKGQTQRMRAPVPADAHQPHKDVMIHHAHYPTVEMIL